MPIVPWWLHQMETLSALLDLHEGNPRVTGGFPSQRPVTWGFDVFFDLRLKKNGRAHNRDTGDLRRHCTHYDVIVIRLCDSHSDIGNICKIGQHQIITKPKNVIVYVHLDSFPVFSNIITVTSQWALWRLKSPASSLFAQPFIQEYIKEHIKATRHWPLCGEFTGDRWISRANGQ